MVRRGTHDRVIRRRHREVVVPPVRGELSDEPGMVGLPDQGERPIVTLADDHDALLADSGQCTRHPYENGLPSQGADLAGFRTSASSRHLSDPHVFYTST